MEKRKAHSRTAWFRIPLLILFFSLPLKAWDLERYGFDVGLSGSLLFTDADSGNLALGAGYQASVFATFDINRAYSLKLQFDSITIEQDFIGEVNLSSDTSLMSLQQRYHLILAGIEKRQDNWFWEAFTGLNLARDSSYEVKNNISQVNSGLVAETRTFLVLGAAIAYYWQYKELNYIARLKTFSLLSNIYDGDLGARGYFFHLPLLLSVGMEF